MNTLRACSFEHPLLVAALRNFPLIMDGTISPVSQFWRQSLLDSCLLHSSQRIRTVKHIFKNLNTCSPKRPLDNFVQKTRLSVSSVPESLTQFFFTGLQLLPCLLRASSFNTLPIHSHVHPNLCPSTRARSMFRDLLSIVATSPSCLPPPTTLNIQTKNARTFCQRLPHAPLFYQAASFISRFVWQCF